MRKIFNFFINKVTLLALIFLVQIAFVVFLIQYFADTWFYINIALTVISVLIVLFLLAKDENPMFKLSWILLISLFPIFGGLFYLMVRIEKFSYKIRRRTTEITAYRKTMLEPIKNLKHTNIEHYKTYLSTDYWKAYNNTQSVFLESGEKKLEALLEELRKAEKFIFMQYFIITKSIMWDKILEILLEKVQQGVEVKIIYDDFGSTTKLPFRYYKFLNDHGIETAVFNKLKLNFKFSLNYRDHRKIVVIDNKTAFTGGINIGDEYINKKKRFGHWHDAGIMITGEAVYSFTAIFLETWAFSKKIFLDPRKYLIPYSVFGDAIYIPFSDSPLDKNFTARNIYLKLINDAKESLYITTPYLILDNELSTALKLAAESGVSVNIIIPKIPDKRLVYMVSEMYVEELIEYGVNIYKYDLGFIHSKLIVSDEKLSMIGTSNLDFRSLYLHFENNLLLDDQKSINEMLEYIETTIAYSTKFTKENFKKRRVIYRLIQAFLKAFSTIL
ncbi:MAG TPA: cardiolipin synthase [Acholeplasma sp.]|jgi:cardiolipin synthase|nr:cardiolipin synthase [Acholeplasma sp.]